MDVWGNDGIGMEEFGDAAGAGAMSVPLTVAPGGSGARANSKSNLKKKFIQMLKIKSQSMQEAVFSHKDLQSLFQQTDMQRYAPDFQAFLDSLNIENYLLVRSRSEQNRGGKCDLSPLLISLRFMFVFW
jgi:hypothetical protein